MRRDPLVIGGLAVVGVAAVVASFSTLAALADSAGWSGWAAWLLPSCLDALAIAAGRVWLAPKAPDPARRYARNVTLSTVGLSVVGNAAGHMVSAGYMRPGLVLVVLVGAVPPAALAAVVHMASKVWAPVPSSSRSRKVEAESSSSRASSRPAAPSSSPVPSRPAVPSEASSPSPVPSSRPVVPSPEDRIFPGPAAPQDDDVEDGDDETVESDAGTDDLLVLKAKKLDAAHRAANNGKPISRDKLRAELGIGNAPASKLLKVIRGEAAA